MILHLLIYSEGTERQFAAYVLKQFSAPEMCSHFVIMSSIKSIDDYKENHNVKVVNPCNQVEMELFVNTLPDYSAIIFHGLFEPWCETVLLRVPERVKVAWVFWGGEIYGRRDLADSYLGPWTKRVFRVRNLLKGIKKKSLCSFELPKDLYQRVDYCLTDMEEEFKFAQDYLNAPGMKFLWYNYYSIEETLGELKESCCDGDSVIVGNSATIECNFFDCLSDIRNICRGDAKVVVPLGYGALWVRNLVVKIGKACLGDCFVPLTSFLTRKDYNSILLSCSAMVQPHYRPQAQGNIITGLWLGMRVFLSERNLAYRYFNRIGVRVFSIERDLNNKTIRHQKLSTDIVDSNRAILSHWYGKGKMRSRLLHLVSVLNG